MRRYIVALFMVLLFLTGGVPDGYAGKRIAVLYFEDHSGFDPASGCGCLPIGPLKFLFGRGSHHIRWDLATGFRDLTIEALDESPYYEVVSFDDLVVAMAAEDITFRDLQKSEQKRARLADRLRANVLLVGDLRKFNQERLKGSASRNVLYRGSDATSAVGGVAAVGYYYRATVEIDLKLFDAMGKALSLSKVKANEVYQVGGVNLAPFRAVASNRGTEVGMGNATISGEIERPIVSYKQLDKIRFGSPEYHKTLFGMATDKAIQNLIRTLQERIGPAPDSLPKSSPPPGVTGRIALVSDSDAYINIGSAQGLRTGQRLTIFAQQAVIDPDTGDVLGHVNQPIGIAEVVEVKSDRFSQIRILEGKDKVQKGQFVQVVPPASPDSSGETPRPETRDQSSSPR